MDVGLDRCHTFEPGSRHTRTEPDSRCEDVRVSSVCEAPEAGSGIAEGTQDHGDRTARYAGWEKTSTVSARPRLNHPYQAPSVAVAYCTLTTICTAVE